MIFNQIRRKKIVKFNYTTNKKNKNIIVNNVIVINIIYK
jgi:hypothetical protein